MKKFILIFGCLLLQAPPKNAAQSFVFSVMIPQYVPFYSMDTVKLMEAELEYMRVKDAKYRAIGRSIKNYPVFIEARYALSKEYRGAVPVRGHHKAPRDPEGVLNLAEDNEAADKLVALFVSEAFGASQAESAEQFKEKMVLTILQNRPKSVFSVKNQSLKAASINQSAIIIKAAWEPRWERVGKSVSYSEVRRYLRALLWEWEFGQKANKADLVQRVQSIIDMEKQCLSQVPYRSLRELLRVCPQSETCLREKIKSNPSLRIYAAIHDADLISIRIFDVGLYSFYEKFAREHFVSRRKFPDLMSTGYCAGYESERYLEKFGSDAAAKQNFAIIFQSIEKDRRARSFSISQDWRAAYYPEPNFLILISQGITMLQFPFLGKAKLGYHKDKDETRESMVIVDKLRLRGDVSVVFDHSYPVTMKLPERMLLQFTGRGWFDFQKDQFVNFDHSQLRAFDVAMPQHSFNKRNHAIVLYHQLGLIDRKFFYKKFLISFPNAFFISAYSWLFENVVYGGSGKVNSNGNNAELGKKLNNEISVQTLVETLNAIFNDIGTNDIGEGIGTILLHICQSFRNATNKHIEYYFGEKILRISPKNMITYCQNCSSRVVLDVARTVSPRLAADNQDDVLIHLFMQLQLSSVLFYD